ncbi:uncharacterized protein LACBIDRAFT_247116, partial [Laccaria bicolor S238N-H82]
VLIIGGGPAGSYAAAALAREGIDVTVLEASKFPRSELPLPGGSHFGTNHTLDTDFIAMGHNNYAWNVVRSEFDQMLLNHARSTGASVYEKTKVEAITFCPSDPKRPISVEWSHAAEVPVRGTTTFTHLIDATGRAGLMSTKYLKNRHFNASLKNIAVWGYWRDVGGYGLGSKRQGSPWFEALTDASGWAWFIPLHNGTTSIGIVMNEKIFATPGASDSAMVLRYLSNLSLAPGVVLLISSTGILNEGSVRSASDFSYSAPIYAGKGFRIVGDAGAFIDPFFSSGVHLAMTSALSAAATICASLRGHCSEVEAAQWHTQRVSTSYTRQASSMPFQMVVLSAYKQIRSQTIDILSDINEDNYDRAFSFLRPVIQGASDMGARLSETELQKSLDFCVNLFNPTTPEQHNRVYRRGDIGKELLDVASPLVDPAVFETTLNVETSFASPSNFDSSDDSETSSDVEKDSETRMVLNKINARRVVHSEYAINNLEQEPLQGYVVTLEKGKLGLSRAV